LTLCSVIHSQPLGPADGIPCDVTVPNGRGIPGEVPSPGLHGNEALSVVLPWPDGIVVFTPGGPGSVGPDGSLRMQFGCRRGVKGRLTIEGRRLDAAGPPLRSHISDGYGDLGLQTADVIFPVPGCWEVVAHVADASLPFVTRVVLIGEGPARRSD